jgi:hypothetical protein
MREVHKVFDILPIPVEGEYDGRLFPVGQVAEVVGAQV